MAGLIRRLLPGFICLLFVLVIAAPAAQSHLQAVMNLDVAWLMLAAGRMLDGGGYSTDFFEVNMPLAIAIYIPAVLLSKLPAISAPDACKLWGILLALQCVFLSYRVLRRYSANARGDVFGTILVLWICFVLFYVPTMDFMQREHMTTILALPYMLLWGLDKDNRGGKGLRAYVSLLAALGFIIKPHYVIAPFLFAGLAALRRRSWSELKQIEALLPLAVYAAFGLLLVTVWSDWFLVLPWAIKLYGSYTNTSIADFQHKAAVLYLLGALLTACLLPVLKSSRLAGVLEALLLGALLSAFAYLTQGKWFAYHLATLTFLVLILLGAALLATLDQWLSPTPRRKELIPVAVILAILVSSCSTPFVTILRNMPKASDFNQFDPAMQATADLRAGESFYIMTTNVWPSSIVALTRGLVWGSRYPCLWPLPMLAWVDAEQAAGQNENRLAGFKKKFIDSVSDDFERYRPKRVLIDRSHMPSSQPGHDALSYFLQDQRFSRIWFHYKPIGAQAHYDLYELTN